MIRLLREEKEARETPPPTRNEILRQLAVAKREMAEFQHMKSMREQRQATIQLYKERIWQRLLTIQEKTEGQRVRAVERYLGVSFRDKE